MFTENVWFTITSHLFSQVQLKIQQNRSNNLIAKPENGKQ